MSSEVYETERIVVERVAETRVKRVVSEGQKPPTTTATEQQVQPSGIAPGVLRARVEHGAAVTPMAVIPGSDSGVSSEVEYLVRLVERLRMLGYRVASVYDNLDKLREDASRYKEVYDSVLIEVRFTLLENISLKYKVIKGVIEGALRRGDTGFFDSNPRIHDDLRILGDYIAKVQYTHDPRTLLEILEGSEEIWFKYRYVTSGPVSPIEVQGLLRLVDELAKLGYGGVIPGGVSREQFIAMISSDRAKYEEALRNARAVVLGYISMVSAVLAYRLSQVESLDPYFRRQYSYVYTDYGEVVRLSGRAFEERDPGELARILGRVAEIHSRYKDVKVDQVKVLEVTYGTIAKYLGELKGEEAQKSLKRFKEALDLLGDKNRLRDLLARYFILMDVVRSETYKSYMNTYSVNLNALVKLLSGKSLTHEELEGAISGALLLLELKEKGALDIEEWARRPPPGPGREGVGEKISGDWFKRKYEDKVKVLNEGRMPGREADVSLEFAELLVKIDPTRHLYNIAYELLKRMLGGDTKDEAKAREAERTASIIAAGITGAVASAVGTLTLPVGIALGVLIVLSTLAEIGTSLSNPVDREALVNALKNNWQDIVLGLAVGAAAGASAAYVMARAKPHIIMELAKRVERYSPSLASRIRGSVELALGTPVYTSKTMEVKVIDFRTIEIRIKAAGYIDKPITVKLGEKTGVLLQDPDVIVKVWTVVDHLDNEAKVGFLKTLDRIAEYKGVETARRFVEEFLNLAEQGKLRGVIHIGEMVSESAAAFPGECIVVRKIGELVIYDLGKKRTITITKNDPLFSPFFTIPYENPDMFALYYIVRVSNLDPKTLGEALVPYIQRFKEVKNVRGTVRFGNMEFRFEGDTMHIVSGVDVLASIKLENFDWFILNELAFAGERFIKAYGSNLYQLVLENLAFGYGLLSPQNVNLKVVFPKSVVSLDLSGLLPPADAGLAYQIVAGNKHLYVAGWLADRLRVGTIVTTEVVKNIMKSTFRREIHTVIEIPPEGVQLIAHAQLMGYKSVDAVKEAASMASKMGNPELSQQLIQLYTTLQLAEHGLASTPVVYISEAGLVVGVVAEASIVSSLAGVSNAIAKGNAQEAQQLLYESLARAGLSYSSAQKVSSTVMTRLSPVVVTITLPRVQQKTTTITTGKLVEAQTQQAKTTTRGVVVAEVKPITEIKQTTITRQDYTRATENVKVKERGVVVPIVEPASETKSVTLVEPKYTSQLENIRDRARGVVLEVVEPVSETEPVTLQDIRYESELKHTDSKARGVVLPVVKTVADQKSRTIVSEDYEVKTIQRQDTARGVVLEVIQPVRQLTLVTYVVDLEIEPGELEPPSPKLIPPHAHTTPIPWPQGIPTQPGTTPRTPPPKGVRQLEEVSV